MAVVMHKVDPFAKFTNRLDDLRKSGGNIGSIGKPVTVFRSTKTCTSRTAYDACGPCNNLKYSFVTAA